MDAPFSMICWNATVNKSGKLPNISVLHQRQATMKWYLHLQLTAYDLSTWQLNSIFFLLAVSALWWIFVLFISTITCYCYWYCRLRYFYSSMKLFKYATTVLGCSISKYSVNYSISRLASILSSWNNLHKLGIIFFYITPQSCKYFF